MTKGRQYPYYTLIIKLFATSHELWVGYRPPLSVVRCYYKNRILIHQRTLLIKVNSCTWKKWKGWKTVYPELKAIVEYISNVLTTKSKVKAPAATPELIIDDQYATTTNKTANIHIANKITNIVAIIKKYGFLIVPQLITQIW